MEIQCQSSLRPFEMFFVNLYFQLRDVLHCKTGKFTVIEV